MPYPGVRRFKRYRPRRRFYNKRYNRRRKMFKLRRTVGLDGLVTKLRYAPVPQSTSGGGLLQSYFGYRNPSSALDWTGLSALYDFYRVFGVKLQWIPTAPNDPKASMLYQPMYIVNDQDDYDNTNFTTSSVYLQYPKCLVKNIYQPFKCYFKVDKLATATRGNAGGITVFNNLGNGFFDINTRPDNGIVTWYSNGLTPSVEYGNFIITLYLAFTKRR